MVLPIIEMAHQWEIEVVAEGVEMWNSFII